MTPPTLDGLKLLPLLRMLRMSRADHPEMYVVEVDREDNLADEGAWQAMTAVREGHCEFFCDMWLRIQPAVLRALRRVETNTIRVPHHGHSRNLLRR